MKKNKSMIIIILLIIILMITACSKTNKESELDNEDQYIEVEENNEENNNENNTDISQTEIMDRFLKMINPETNAGDLGKYIEDNIQDVNYEDAEEMIKWLIIYQTEVIEDFNNNIYNPGYLEALNEDLGGILDKTKIKNIKDQDIRDDYQKLKDGFLTIVRYEEHPVVETNWKGLYEFSSYVSEDYSEMIRLYEKIQNYEYDREELDIVGISEDIIRTEKLLKKKQTKFVEEKLNELYSMQIYALLVGPEGSYLNIWIDKNSEDYKSIIKLQEKYPESILAEIILDTDKAENQSMDLIRILNKKLQFRLNANKYIEEVTFNKDNGEYNIIEIRIPDNKDKEDKINKFIRMDLESYVQDNNIDRNFNLTIFHSFEDERYISYEGVLTHEGLQENYVEMLSFYRTLDYIDEKFISLEDYFNTDFNTIKTDIERITGNEIEYMPDFLLSYTGIDLFLNEADGMDGYIHLNKKDLVPYMNGR